MVGSSSVRGTTCCLVVLALAACSAKGAKAPAMDAAREVTGPIPTEAGPDRYDTSPPDLSEALADSSDGSGPEVVADARSAEG